MGCCTPKSKGFVNFFDGQLLGYALLSLNIILTYRPITKLDISTNSRRLLQVSVKPFESLVILVALARIILTAKRRDPSFWGPAPRLVLAAPQGTRKESRQPPRKKAVLAAIRAATRLQIATYPLDRDRRLAGRPYWLI